MNAHVADRAALYASGALEDRERAQVERHAARCEPCAMSLAQASEDAAEIASCTPLMEAPAALQTRLSRASNAGAAPRTLWRIPAALAAALLLAILPAYVAVDRSQSALTAMAQDERALARLAAAPFNRATFMAGTKPMDAKVLYGRRGDWYYVVVMHPGADLQVAYVQPGRMEMLGTVAIHGESGSLYLPVNHRMDELALLRGTTVIARAHLLYGVH